MAAAEKRYGRRPAKARRRGGAGEGRPRLWRGGPTESGAVPARIRKAGGRKHFGQER